MDIYSKEEVIIYLKRIGYSDKEINYIIRSDHYEVIKMQMFSLINALESYDNDKRVADVAELSIGALRKH